MTPGFQIETDLAHGGRWRGLRDPSGREWLWRGDARGRDDVRPGDAFVDAGGFEECYPTIGGSPDHGDVWTREWSPGPDGPVSTAAWVRTGQSLLTRTVTIMDSAMSVDYELQAEPGHQFIWAGHALLELAVGAVISAPPGPVHAFPGHGEAVATTWPNPLGINFGALPEDDGTAMFCILLDCQQVIITDGDSRLRIRLESAGQPAGFGLWRNLGGFPWDGTAKYRNIGVEPMLGYDFHLSRADPTHVATVPASGRVSWRVEIDNG